MNEEPEEEWSESELPEGFDVYGYDAKRARAGQFMVVTIFSFVLLLFALSMYFSYRDQQRWQKDHPGRVSNDK